MKQNIASHSHPIYWYEKREYPEKLGRRKGQDQQVIKGTTLSTDDKKNKKNNAKPKVLTRTLQVNYSYHMVATYQQSIQLLESESTAILKDSGGFVVVGFLQTFISKG